MDRAKTPQKALLHAALRILRGLIRILLRQRIPYPLFSELARWTYADLAEREFRLQGRKQSNSRVAMLTGLSRKEVLRLKRLPSPTDNGDLDRYQRGSRIISAWLREPGYQDAAGHPLPLKFDADGPSFSALVSRFGTDVPPRAVLDELLDNGNLSRTPAGRLQLNSRGFLTADKNNPATAYHILGWDTEALLETIDHNLESAAPERHFQRKVAYRGLAPDAVASIRKHAARRSQELLEELDRMMAAAVSDRANEQPTEEIMLGIYWHQSGVHHD